ncbi:MAG: nucleotidyl transferase AbiEii/AbiGii toxin family protein [Candidatus Aenigmarchaeota archaeon]|nr:nucleotidyl transferase AbiEii/AbiGii toxin family protein [Candidatus Aenigmarchaeota archaeon]
MSINFFELKELSRSVNLPLENTEKELFHDIFLYSLFNIPRVEKYTRHLVFKGGTCLHKCYGFPRFSEDLDFEIIAGKLNRKRIDSLFNRHVTNTVREIFGFGNVNFRIKENSNGFNVHTDVRGPAFSQTHRNCHVKFDLSSRKKLIYGAKEVKHDASLFLNYYDVDGIISLRTTDPKEIFAEKIVTILDKKFVFGQRDEARDLFDIYILLLKGHSCGLRDIRKKLPADKKDVFTLKNFSDSVFHTAKPIEWKMMIDQLIIGSKLKGIGLTIEDISFEKVSKKVLDKVRKLYFQ